MANKQNTTRLTAQTLKKEVNKFNDTQTIEVLGLDDELGLPSKYTLKIYPHFAASRVDDLIQEYLKVTSEFYEKDYNTIGEALKDSMTVLQGFIILYFSDILTNVDKVSTNKKLEIINNIIELEMIVPIIDHFPIENIQKVSDAFVEAQKATIHNYIATNPNFSDEQKLEFAQRLAEVELGLDSAPESPTEKAGE